MDNIFLQVVIILTLIFLNGLLAMSEIAVVASRKARLQQRAEAGNEGARIALELANDPSRFLSTVQIGITLVGIFTGAFGGATIAGRLSGYLDQFPGVARYSGTIAIGVVVVLTTYLSLVLGELAPKQIALTHSERIAALVSRPMAFLSRITSPAVKLLSLSTTAVLRLLRLGTPEDATVTEEEVRILIGQGTEMGVFEQIEEEMVKQVFRMSDQRALAHITPRTEIVYVDLEDPQEVNRQKIILGGHSQLPVVKGDLDDVQGYVRAIDLLARCLQGEPLDIHAVLRPPLFVPESVPVFDLLEQFKENRTQIAFALDEFAGLQGLVTLQDILESIIEDIGGPENEVDPDVLLREDGSYLIDGMLPADEFREIFDLEELPGEGQEHFQTLGGFVMTFLGRIPAEGDRIDYRGLRLEVMDMDGHRVDKLLVSRLDAPESPEA
ncbi:MAG TPA: hemolysin family protein [Anaerolineales bacterium]